MGKNPSKNVHQENASILPQYWSCNNTTEKPIEKKKKKNQLEGTIKIHTTYVMKR